jgi:bacillithiol synthase
MPNDRVSYTQSGYFSQLIIDYLDSPEKISHLFGRYPVIENFESQMAERIVYATDRQVLFNAITNQYRNLAMHNEVARNIDSLKNSDSFTVTTGHQLNLFTGPLYFIYKIFSTINLCRTLKEKHPDKNFVPVYWMATEDHDFEEISHFTYDGKKYRWDTTQKGPVGRFKPEGIDQVSKRFFEDLGHGKSADRLRELFGQAYLGHHSLADAARWLVNELFGTYGLVIIDGDDRQLKKQFLPVVERELQQQMSYNCVSQTIEEMAGYTIQVNPREINLFYMIDGLRERLVKSADGFAVLNTTLTFTQEELLEQANSFPERFSPNVILRPVYQEMILPNLCYIGGGAEIAYWLQLKSTFDALALPFPILMLRDSVLLASQKQITKASRLDLEWVDLFLKKDELVNRHVGRLSNLSVDFAPLKEVLDKQFQLLAEIAKETHLSFDGAVKAQAAKQIKGLENLEKRLLKAEKKQHRQELIKITDLKDQLFPGGVPQERVENFSTFYERYGDQLLEVIQQNLNPLDNVIKTIALE